MNINYIILAHRQEKQVRKLIDSLKMDCTSFYIHVDKNSDIAPFKNELMCYENIVFLENKQRRMGTWGDIGIVEATVNALKLITKNNQFGYVALLSGQDYPIRSNEDIKDFFKINYGINFMSTWKMPYEKWEMLGGMQRLSMVKVNKSNKKGDYNLLFTVFDTEFYYSYTFKHIKHLFNIGKFKFIFQLFKRRKLPYKLKPFGGWQWWAIPMETANTILDFLKKHPRYLRFHKYSLLPDEMFFQTIIMNSTQIMQKNIMPNLTYTRWDTTQPSPDTFTSRDFDELMAQTDKLFARKFDVDLDSHIINLIDEELNKRGK